MGTDCIGWLVDGVFGRLVGLWCFLASWVCGLSVSGNLFRNLTPEFLLEIVSEIYGRSTKIHLEFNPSPIFLLDGRGWWMVDDGGGGNSTIVVL